MGFLFTGLTTFLYGLRNAAICVYAAPAAGEHLPYEERIASNGQASTSSVHVIDSRPSTGRPSMASLDLSTAPAGMRPVLSSYAPQLECHAACNTMLRLSCILQPTCVWHSCQRLDSPEKTRIRLCKAFQRHSARRSASSSCRCARL